MSPSGDGDREISRHELGSFGERKPLDVLPLVAGGDAGIFGFERRGGRRWRDDDFEGLSSGGLRDWLDSEASSRTPDNPCLRAADRVTGAKYPSRASVSESDGDGDMTRGVSGTALEEAGMSEDLTAKGGSDDDRPRPKGSPVQV